MTRNFKMLFYFELTSSSKYMQTFLTTTKKINKLKNHNESKKHIQTNEIVNQIDVF